MVRRAVPWLLLSVLAGCSLSISATPLPGTDGFEFCSKLADQARRLASGWATTAWVLCSFVLGGIGIGNLLGNQWEQPNLAWYQRARGMLVLVVALAIVPFTYYGFSRSNAAALAAGSANAGLKAKDAASAYRTCVDAKTVWITSRTESNAIGVAALRQAENATEKAEEAVAEAQAIRVLMTEKLPAAAAPTDKPPTDKPPTKPVASATD